MAFVYPTSTVGGRVFTLKGVGNGDTPGTVSAVQTFTVAAVSIKRAIQDGISFLKLNFPPAAGGDKTEIFSVTRNPAKAAPPDTIIDASSAMPINITVEVDPSADGYVIAPGCVVDARTGDPVPVVFNEGERVTYTVLAANPTNALNKCAWLERAGDSTVAYELLNPNATDPDTETSVGDYAQVTTQRSGSGLVMSLVLKAADKWPEEA